MIILIRQSGIPNTIFIYIFTILNIIILNSYLIRVSFFLCTGCNCRDNWRKSESTHEGAPYGGPRFQTLFDFLKHPTRSFPLSVFNFFLSPWERDSCWVRPWQSRRAARIRNCVTASQFWTLYIFYFIYLRQ